MGISGKVGKAGQVLLLGLVMEVLFLFVLNLGNLRDETRSFLFLYALIFLVYLAGVCLLKQDRRALYFILVFAVLFRLTLLADPPTLSEDIYRYQWDAKVANHGINPFLYPPDAEEIAFLRDANFENINHKHLTTIYPPLSQLIFAAIYFINPGIPALKLGFFAFDLLSILLILLILKERRLSQNNVLIYAWNPLVIVEFASSGHNDVIAISLVLLAYFARLKNKGLLCSIVLALAVLAKPYALLMVPFFLGRRNLAPFLFTVLMFYLPFLGAGGGLFYSLRVYAETWMFNPGLFSIFDYLFNGRYALYALLLAAYWFLLPKKDILASSFAILGIYLLLSPVVHPWYVCWIVPFLCIFRSRGWIAFTFLVALSYTFYISWTEIWWVRLLEYAVFYVLLILERKNKLPYT